ncbi:MAG: Rdx family protein [Chloroflexota bacterium]|nr:Rdx family protein [Chloroflexota bacterium]
MTEKLLDEFGNEIEAVKLVPSSGGVFEVEVDGNLIYSKKATRRHATWEEVRDAINALG